MILEKDNEGRTFSKYCSCKKSKDNQRRLARTALADKVEQYKLNNYIAKEDWQQVILSSAKKYVKEYNGWFYIGGQVGTGKTHICTGIIQNISYLYSLSFEYILFNKKMTELKQLKFEDKEKYNDILNWLFNVDILFIDDLYKTEPTKADLDILFDIVNERYLSNKTCIFSSEKFISEIFEYDEAISSRILEKCGEYVLSISRDMNKNYRLKIVE